jgi:thymidylate kinase
MRQGIEMKGRLIAIEGIDSSGKTTLVQLINKELLHKGYHPIVLEEFGTIVGQFFFESVVAKDLGVAIPAQVLLRAAGQISEIIKNSRELDNYKTIFLADRYVDSNVIYQSIEYSLRQTEKEIDAVSFQEWARSVYGLFYIKPIKTFILDLPVHVAIARAKFNNKPIKPVHFLEFARHEYIQRASKDSQEYVIIDATESPDKVLSSVVEHISTFLS